MYYIICVPLFICIFKWTRSIARINLKQITALDVTRVSKDLQKMLNF